MMQCRLAGRAGVALTLLCLVGLPLRAEETKKPSTSATIAHIKLSGNPGESAPSEDPLLGPLHNTFRGLLERIKKAQNDKEIKALLLQIDGLGVGWGKLEELTRAIHDFRKSGKKVIAYVEAGSAKDYLAALACDEVCMPPSGTLMLVGIRAEIGFYKTLLEKHLSIKADIIRMGDAKTAAEPYTRTDLSPASRKQYELVIGDFYDREIVGRIVAARKNQKFTAEKVKKLIDHGPHTAQEAFKLGLIDRLAYANEVEKEIKKALKVDQLKITRNYGKKKADLKIEGIWDIIKLFKPRTSASTSKTKVAVVYVNGPITTGKSSANPLFGDMVGSTTIVEAINKANDDKTVKAIVLRVDSPGGSALASDLIWHAIKQCDKPVVASMSDVAGSGGYYVCMSCQKIYAEPGTLTGSIGVLGGKIALGGLYEKIGINTDVISRGANSGILSSTDPFTKSERERIRALMREIYDQFLDKALAGRKQAGVKMTREDLVKVAGGRIWTGRQAKEIGLIDELGTLADAVAGAKKLAGITEEAELLELPAKKGFLESLLEEADLTTPNLRAEQKLLQLLPEVRAKVSGAAILLHLRKEPAWVIMPHLIDIR
jgi:protease-4